MDAMGFTREHFRQNIGISSLRKIGLHKVEKKIVLGGSSGTYSFSSEGETSDQIHDKSWRLISGHL